MKLTPTAICKEVGKHLREAIERVNELDNAAQLLGPAKLKKAIYFARKSTDDTQTIILKTKDRITTGQPLPWEDN
jgi:beta-galactosidase beta subunit